jgi:hypothetical protein
MFALAWATTAGSLSGDAASGGGYPDGCRSGIYGCTVVLVGGRWVICAPIPTVHNGVLLLGEAADDSSTGLWSVVASSSTDEVDLRAAAWGPADLSNDGG